jgi:hypothetical protein
MTLQISDTLSLPKEIVTEGIAFLGRRRSGKSYAATKLAELMHGIHAQFIAMDPVGIWYGLRLGADGKSPGLDIPILGGLHGDVPIEPTSGKLIADLVVDETLSAVIDVSQFESDADRVRFAQDFAARLFFRKKSSPSALHMFLEEAQEWVPQNPQKNETIMLHGYQRLVRLGGNYGIGMSLISQRPQDVNKKALNQVECVFAFQLTGPQERDAVEYWIHEKGITDDLDAILPKLKQGHAHVWSPVLLNVSREVHIAKKETFAAGSTPKVGAKIGRSTNLEPLEIEALKQKMASTIQKAKAEDPRELRRRIAELEAELRKKGAAVIDSAAIERARSEGERAAEARCRSQIEQLRKTIDSAARVLGAAPAVVTEPAKKALPTPRPSAAPVKVRTLQVSQNGHSSISAGQRKILSALAQYPDGRTDSQVAILTGYAVGSGNFNNLLSTLRSSGWAEGTRSGLRITAEGLAALGHYEVLPTGHALLEYWCAKLSKAERSILQHLAEAFPQSLSDEEIAARAGYAAGTGNFNNALSRLRTLQLLQGGRRELRASEALFG